MIHRSIAALVASLLLFAPGGCETSGRTGMLAGAGMGALMGQAIGGNTTATLIGAGVGTGIGYIIGNEMDKSRAAAMTEAQAAQNAQGGAGGGAPVLFTNTEVGPLGGTRWLLVSVNPRDAAPPHASMLVEFRPNGRVLTTTTTADGQVLSADECYRVVGDTLIINRPGYLINARFQIANDQLILSADRFSAVLRRLPS